MKKILTLSVAVLAISFVLAGCKTPAQTENSAPATEANIAAAGEIVYFHMDSLLNHFDFFKDLQADFEAKAQVVSDDVQKKGRAFEKDVTDFQQKIQKGLMTRSQAETQEQQLGKRQQELEQYSQQKQMELTEEQQVMLNRVLDAIKTYIQSYNEIHNYALILTTDASTNNVIVGNPRLDITQQLIEGLNKEYANKSKE